MAAPISFEAALRRSWARCRSRIAARRFSSSAISNSAQGAEPAPGEARIERLRIVAYRLDVVHKSPGIERAAQPAVAEHVEREARHYQKRAGKLNRP